MKKTPVTALVASGVTRPEFLGRLPVVARRLGPVLSSSFRLASRTCNALRAGSPARSWAELGPADVIFWAVPSHHSREFLGNASAQGFSWQGKIAVIVGSPDENPPPHPGGEVVFLEPIDWGGELVSLLTPESSAAALVARMVESSGSKAIVANKARRLRILAATYLAGPGVESLLGLAEACLRQAGVGTKMARRSLSRQMSSASRALLRSGRRVADEMQLTEADIAKFASQVAETPGSKKKLSAAAVAAGAIGS